MKSWLRVVQKQIYTKCRKSISHSNLQKYSEFSHSQNVATVVMQYTAAYTHGQSACGDWRKWSTQFNMRKEHTAACGLHSTGRSPAVNIASTVLRSAASIPAWWNPTPYTNSSERKESVKARMVSVLLVAVPLMHIHKNTLF